jgi:phosphoribulokinase
MAERMATEAASGNHAFSHFGPAANLFEELEALFRDYGERGTGRPPVPATRPRRPLRPGPAPSPPGRTCRATPTCCSTRGCTGPW